MTMLLRFAFLLIFALAARAAGQPVPLRAGAAQADITPEPEVLNWVTGKPYGVVLDPLAVHALVLDDGRTKVAVIRWDIVDVSESAREEMRRVVGAALGMPGENILVHASHNHSGPWAPHYGGNYRGRERDPWWALRFMPPQYDYPPFQRWVEKLRSATVDAAKRAAASARPVTLSIGRVAVSEYLHNRRPRAAAWGLADAKPAPVISHSHPEWNPEVLQAGATFGPMDRTLALVAFRDESDRAVASLFHVACHAVSIYPSNPGISADWPGAASKALAGTFGGEALFLQGCAGDMNPWRRGAGAVATMAGAFAQKAQAAAKYSVKLAPAPLQVLRTSVDLPLTPAAKERIGGDTVAAEIQIITCGPLALVALPGEPMTELNTTIRERSPFPQTLVLGYSNGNGAHYVGMPGEKMRGGYEAGVPGAGTDECALIMIDAAVRLLGEAFARGGHGTPR
jgi:neutral ceramidase